MTMTTLPGRPVRPPHDDDFAAARGVVSTHLSPTPLIAANADDRVWLKLETLQPTGSFKIRGALAAADALPAGGTILTASAGNHALGIAHASARLRVPATIVIAESASPRKRALLERLPITLIRHGASYDEAEAHALDLARRADDGAHFISAYNDPHVIAGHATIVDEIVAATPPDRPLTIVTPGSGGGLIAGVAIRAAHLSTPARPIRVVGVESARSVALSTAVSAGSIVRVPVGETIADGLAGNLEAGSVTVELIRGQGVELVSIAEDALWAALRSLAFEHGVIAEGAGAAAFAAIRERLVTPRAGETLVAIVSGRNIAPDLLLRVLAG